MNVLRRTRNFATLKCASTLRGNNINNRTGFKIKICHRNNFHVVHCYHTKFYVGSRYCPLSPLEQAEIKMREKFFGQKHFTVVEWNTIKHDLMIEFYNITEENFDSILMNSLLLFNNVQLSRSFMKYLNEISHKPNFVTYLKYMVLCSRHLNICDQHEILSAFEKIKPLVNSSPVLDMNTLNCVVHGLCATDQWRKAFDYLNKYPSKQLLLETKNALASTALINNDECLAWDIMSNWYRSSEVPSVNVINSYIKFASSILDKDPEMADTYFMKFLMFLKSKNVVLKSECTEAISWYFERHPRNWTVSHTKVNRSGYCHSCSNKLDGSDLTEEQLNELKTVFFKKCMKKNDFYINSTTHEMEKFLDYIQNHKPFDIIVDGLNAAHYDELKVKETLATQLLEVVKCLTVCRQRVLVLGRKHMLRWPRKIMELISSRAKIFFTNNISEDDPFVIYAALNSGLNTLFVSSDLMRDHIANIDDPMMCQLFQKWQQSHQIYLSPSENGPAFKGPLKHHISIQGSMENGWHIPYDDEFVLDPYQELNNWMCIQQIAE